MSAIRPELLVKPWLFDAMSGEIKPPTDPDEKTHTIGRLANAAHRKGQRSFDATPMGSIIGEQYSYRPSWAPNVEAFVRCDILGETPVLRGIALQSDSGVLLSVNNVQGAYLAIYARGELLEVPFADERTNVARDTVTDLAADFFRDVHYDNALN